MRRWPNRLSLTVLATATSLAIATVPAQGVGGLDVENRSLGFGTAGYAYPTEDVSATGTGTTPYTWSVTAGALPPGLGLTTVSEKARISGTPTTTGTYTFTLQVADSGTATATRQFTIPIYPVLQVTTTSLPNGAVSTAYSQTLSASGGSGTYSSWSLTNGTLPPGLTLSSG
ncbi:MAG: putative Ig domain-containing protein [Actinomycetales bacterium]